jgi:hypothetical protein
MAFLYGLLRAAAAAMRLVAAFRHARAKTRYEQFEQAFQAREEDCKAHEVQFGRPVDYGAQLQLLRAFEARERARAKWIRAAGRLDARQRREGWLTDLSGTKLPYTFGLVDMALVLHALDKAGLPFGYDVVSLFELLRDLM